MFSLKALKYKFTSIQLGNDASASQETGEANTHEALLQPCNTFQKKKIFSLTSPCISQAVPFQDY